MAHLATVEVKCFGDQQAPFDNPAVHGYPFTEGIFEGNPRRVKQALMTLATCLRFNAAPIEADVVHCHTWYTMWGGIVAKLGYGTPLVATVHSLEPLRPWKREQLGRGYDLSSWVERAALEMADRVIAVSASDRQEILSRFRVAPERLRVIPNGIDTGTYRPMASTAALATHGIDPLRPYVLFLGRLTRQKGVGHFLRAAEHLDPGTQVVLCASAPDTPEIAREVEQAVSRLAGQRRGVIWIREMVERAAAIELYSHATVFCCPSIYEPFGIINLEAMACETPVVASAVGGITEVVRDGETGILVPFRPRSSDDPEPADPDGFARGLAAGINRLAADRTLARQMGHRGRQRVTGLYGWPAIARQVFSVYQELMPGDRHDPRP
ncbi:MAG: glycogen synthase, partial [Thermodesulfobacteriota bacterium]